MFVRERLVSSLLQLDLDDTWIWCRCKVMTQCLLQAGHIAPDVILSRSHTEKHHPEHAQSIVTTRLECFSRAIGFDLRTYLSTAGHFSSIDRGREQDSARCARHAVGNCKGWRIPEA